jgi:DNA-binding PadR family transcriptional regulator
MTTPNPTSKSDSPQHASPTNHSPNDYTRFQLDLLAVIAGYETGRYRDDRHSSDLPHGLAIKNTLEDYYAKDVNHGRLYPNLDTLVEDGLVEKSQADRRTNYYRLTDDGWEYLHRRAQFVVGCLDEGDADPATAHGGVEDDKTDGIKIPETEIVDAADKFATLGEVAAYLDVTQGRARTLLVHAGVYGEVTEGGR